MHPPIARCIISLQSEILFIIRIATHGYSQVRASAVQAIAILVLTVTAVAMLKAKDLAVHGKPPLTIVHHPDTATGIAFGVEAP